MSHSISNARPSEAQIKIQQFKHDYDDDAQINNNKIGDTSQQLVKSTKWTNCEAKLDWI